MIEINLLPEELKTRHKEALPLTGILVYAILFLAGVLASIHLLYGGHGLARAYRLRQLQASWKRLEPQQRQLAELREKFDIASGDTKFLQQLMGERIAWPKKLHALSLNLPSGIWFNEITFNRKNVLIKGSALSLAGEEMYLINTFMENLKTDKGFFEHCASLDLTSVQRRIIGGYEVVDFVLVALLQ